MKTTILGIKKAISQYRELGEFNIRNNKNTKRYMQANIKKIFFNNMMETIKEAEAQIERGEGRDADEVLREWQKKYG